MTRRSVSVAAIAAFGAFALYRSTLLPGLDFGDTASFQATAGQAAITPRDGYPLYFAVASLFLALTRSEPAYALNLLSAIQAAMACGVLVLAAEELAGSLPAGLAAATLFAASYTFWSQAIIAEVYALHMLLVGLTLLLILRWQNRPEPRRLAAFLAVYALAFGNHLSMILLAPAYTVFLLVAGPEGWRSTLRPRVVALAAAFACLGALQYAWNVRTLLSSADPPHGFADALSTFWFDVTKSDWRDTMVLNVPRSMLVDRARMYAFDLRQQFGTVVPLLAVAGLARLGSSDWRRAVLLATVYVTTTLFAYGYNVGDTHVFYLASHASVALLVAPGVVCVADMFYRMAARLHGGNRAHSSWFPPLTISRRFAVGAVASLTLVYAGVRIHHDYPALDRHGDQRPVEALSAITEGLDDVHAVLLTDFNWQVQNGLSYFTKVTRPEVLWARTRDVLLYAPILIRDNADIGRQVLLTERARDEVSAAFGTLLAINRDPRVQAPATIAGVAAEIAPGTRYALCILKPTREFKLDIGDLAAALRALTRGAIDSIPDADYVAVAGHAGDRPTLFAAANTPFRETRQLGGVPVEIRMESWLAADTIRRMGFGHVIAARHHTMILERGANFVTFDTEGRAIQSRYAAGIFAAQSRYVVSIRQRP